MRGEQSMDHKKSGVFYAVGVGPGNPEMMTLEAVRVLKEADVIAAPRDTVEGSVVYGIALVSVPEIADKEKLAFHLPMTRSEDVITEAHRAAADRTEALLNQGKNVAAMTLGDPGIFATTVYILRLLREDGYQTKLISGIPSFTASANACGTGLATGEDEIRIVSAKQYLAGDSDQADVTVIMKSGKQMPVLKKKLMEECTDVQAVMNCGTKDEQIFRSAADIPDDAGYYTLVLARRQKKTGIVRKAERMTKEKVNLITVVGIGPGKEEGMTYEAMEALRSSDVIVTYTAYAALLSPLLPDKDIQSTGMRAEAERCKMTIALAEKGKKTVLACSGDAGVYGMAGLLLELAVEHPTVGVKVIPGVTAALSGAAVLGAPLTNDFAVISLSDLLTPQEVIEKRLTGAGMGDFCIALYNPGSKKRADALKKACDILLRYKAPKTLCGYVRNIGREGEAKTLLSLQELRDTSVDMFTTVFIGNAQTKDIDGCMVTPRGYHLD